MREAFIPARLRRILPICQLSEVNYYIPSTYYYILYKNVLGSSVVTSPSWNIARSNENGTRFIVVGCKSEVCYIVYYKYIIRYRDYILIVSVDKRFDLRPYRVCCSSAASASFSRKRSPRTKILQVKTKNLFKTYVKKYLQTVRRAWNSKEKFQSYFFYLNFNNDASIRNIGFWFFVLTSPKTGFISLYRLLKNVLRLIIIHI